MADVFDEQTRTIVIGEPASIGTLLELAETCLDFARTTASSASLKDESTQVLEATLVLAVAQLALWERRPPSSSHHHHDGRMRREMAELVGELLELLEKASGGPTGLGRSVGPAAAKARGKEAEPELMQVLGMFARANLRKGD